MTYRQVTAQFDRILIPLYGLCKGEKRSVEPKMFLRSIDGLAVAKAAELAARISRAESLTAQESEPVTQFFNKCHDSEDGRFCGGSSAPISGNMDLGHDFMPEYKGGYKEGLQVESQEWIDDNKRVNQEAWHSYTEAEEKSFEAPTRAFYENVLPDARNSRTSEQREAFKEYGEVANETINKQLRGTLVPYGYPPVLKPVKPLEKDYLPALDAAFATGGQRPGKTMLYRGISDPDPLKALDLSQFEPGSVITDKAFMSTSISKQTVKEGFSSPKGAILRIRSDESDDALLEPGVSSEGEAIYNRNTPLYVRNRYVDRDGYTIIDAEVV